MPGLKLCTGASTHGGSQRDKALIRKQLVAVATAMARGHIVQARVATTLVVALLARASFRVSLPSQLDGLKPRTSEK